MIARVISLLYALLVFLSVHAQPSAQGNWGAFAQRVDVSGMQGDDFKMQASVRTTHPLYPMVYLLNRRKSGYGSAFS